MKTTKTPVRKSPAKPPAARKAAAAKKPAVRKAAPRKAAVRQAPDPLLARVQQVRAILDSKKGENIALLRITNVSSITDYLVLCTGLNIPHLRALADEVAKQLRQETPPLAAHRRAGSAESEWFVLDYIDFVVHLFTPRMRAYYALEQLWKDAPVVS
jgi:ribosome-associated protein